jgi:outer membrane protein
VTKEEKAMAVGRMFGALAVLLAAAVWSAPAAEGPRPLKIGVVDIDKVLREYKKSDDLYKKIGEDFAPLEEALKKKSEMIRAEQRKLVDSGRDPESVELFKDRQALELRIAEFRTEEKKLALEAAAAKLRAMNEVWNDLLKAVEKQAKDRGLDLVIKQQLRTGDARNAESFHNNVSACTVLYHSDQLDLTEEMIKAMNAEYERGGKPPATPEPKTPVAPPKTGGRKG